MIKIQHLKKTFDNVTMLRDVNAEIAKGEVIAILGPSGIGKSTFLRCINLLEQPTSGQILIDGVDITDKKTDLLKIRQKIGMVFQKYNLFTHKMVIENVMMAPMDLQGLSRQEAFDEGVRFLQMVGLGEKLYAYPDELSGGEQQRVAIARCLAMKPEILLFDEPTSALDPMMVGEVQGVIRQLARQGMTMVVVTNDLKFSREIATRIFFMEEGTILEDGTPEEVLDCPKNEKTKAFMKRLRTWEYTVCSADFDLYRMNAEIEEFGWRQGMTPKQLQTLELLIEELMMNQILAHTRDIQIQVSYFEEDSRLEISFSYGGEPYNPFDTEKENALSMLLVRQYAKNIRYQYLERNVLQVEAGYH